MHKQHGLAVLDHFLQMVVVDQVRNCLSAPHAVDGPQGRVQKLVPVTNGQSVGRYRNWSYTHPLMLFYATVMEYEAIHPVPDHADLYFQTNLNRNLSYVILYG